MGVVHIPGGPRIDVAHQDRDERKMQVSRETMAMVTTLVECGAWPWFVAQCEARAGVFERQVLAVGKAADPRMEDRWRGMADAYRQMPKLIEQVAAKAAKQQPKEQQ